MMKHSLCIVSSDSITNKSGFSSQILSVRPYQTPGEFFRLSLKANVLSPGQNCIESELEMIEN